MTKGTPGDEVDQHLLILFTATHAQQLFKKKDYDRFGKLMP